MFKMPDNNKTPRTAAPAADHRDSPIPGENPIPGQPPMPGEPPTPSDPPVVPPSPTARRHVPFEQPAGNKPMPSDVPGSNGNSFMDE